MKAKVTEDGINIPKQFLEGMDEVEIRREDGVVLVVPINSHRPVFDIGTDPLEDEITDASVNHDHYIHNGK